MRLREGGDAVGATGCSRLVEKRAAEDPEDEIPCRTPIFMAAAMTLGCRPRFLVVNGPTPHTYRPNMAVRVTCGFGMVEKGAGKDLEAKKHHRMSNFTPPQ